MAVTHTFASAKADGPDATLVQPSDWNADHTIGTVTTVVEDARTNTVTRPITAKATTSGAPAAGIGTGIQYEAESADENPCIFGATDFVASDVGAGSEDTYFEVLLRIAGAAIAAAYRFACTTAFRAIFTHANSADRTYTLPDATGTLLASGSLSSPVRAVDTIYQNTSGRTRVLMIAVAIEDAASRFRLEIDTATPPTTVRLRAGVTGAIGNTSEQSMTAVVPNNSYYRLARASGSPTIDTWTEIDL